MYKTKGRFWYWFLLSLLCLTVFFFGACKAEAEEEEEENPPQTPSYALNVETLDMFIGESFQVTVSELAEGDTVTWGSSNVSVATVDGGLVTAIANGEATITAIVGETAIECEVSVAIAYAAVPVVKLADEIERSDGTYAIKLLVGDEYGFSPYLQCGEERAETTFTLACDNASISVSGMKITTTGVCENAQVIVSCTYEGSTYSATVYVTAE